LLGQKEDFMNAKVLYVAGFAIAAVCSTPVLAQTSSTTTTTTWSTDQGAALQKYSTTQSYKTVEDPSMHPAEGMVVPESVTLYPLPSTMSVPDASSYGYTVVNSQPIVVNKTTRKVVHTWIQAP